MVGGEPRPQGERFPVGGFRAGRGLGSVLEDVAAGDQLWQHHDAGAERDGVGDGVGDAFPVCGRVAQGWGELAAGNDNRVHRPESRGPLAVC